MLNKLREAVGRASKVPAIVDDSFEQGCIFVLIEAYKRLKLSGDYELNWHENRFTAYLVIYIEQICGEEDINLLVDPECSQYFDNVLNGTQDPNRAPRIDIRLKGGWVNRDVYYGIEAKILVEHNWSTKDASKLRKRYIKTGIDHFVAGKYAPIVTKGCLVGYVLEGQPIKIQQAINKWLMSNNREREVLMKQRTINEYEFCFESDHLRKDGKPSHLYHILLSFV